MGYLFTSESVSEGHPDKVSDQISDAIVDLFLSKDPEARIACETLTTTQLVVLAGLQQRHSVPVAERKSAAAQLRAWLLHRGTQRQQRAGTCFAGVGGSGPVRLVAFAAWPQLTCPVSLLTLVPAAA